MDSRVSPYPPGPQKEEPHQQSMTGSPSRTNNNARAELENLSSHSPNRPSPPSPPGTFANNFSMRSELENIKISDHYYNNNKHDDDEDEALDNVNIASLMLKIRQIRSSGQIQYRVPKQRIPKSKKSGDEMEVDEAELSDEIVTINRQKRVRKAPTRARVSPYDRRGRKLAKEGGRPAHSTPTLFTKPTEAPISPETTSKEPSVPEEGFEPRP